MIMARAGGGDVGANKHLTAVRLDALNRRWSAPAPPVRLASATGGALPGEPCGHLEPDPTVPRDQGLPPLRITGRAAQVRRAAPRVGSYRSPLR